MDQIKKFIMDNNIQRLEDKFSLPKDKFSPYKWQAPVIQQPNHLKEYVKLIGMFDAVIQEIAVVEYPCMFGPPSIQKNSWTFEFDNPIVLITTHGNFEITFNESSSVRISKDSIPKKFRCSVEDLAHCHLQEPLSHLIDEKITGITVHEQTFDTADFDFTGSCGIDLPYDLPAYIKEMRLHLKSERHLSFSSDFDWGIISLIDS